jgi:hypothetical protein
MAIVDGLITLVQAKASLNIASTTTVNDSDIERYIEACTPLIEFVTGPQIVRSRTFTFDGGDHVVVLPVRFNTVTSITVDSVAITDWVAESGNGIIHSGLSTSPTNFNSGTQNVVVVVTVGNATIPSNVQLATRELVRHLWQLGRQANRPGTAEAQTQTVPEGFAMPRRVLELLSANPRVAGFA